MYLDRVVHTKELYHHHRRIGTRTTYFLPTALPYSVTGTAYKVLLQSTVYSTRTSPQIFLLLAARVVPLLLVSHVTRKRI